MNFAAIRIVLVATSHPGNIGSTARAMKTMGLSRLYLVTPKAFPDIRAFEMAAGAEDLFEHAVITTTLKEALTDCQLIVGTSARTRDLDLQELLPNQCAELIVNQSAKTEIAIVFGREHAGLTNEELLCCHYHVTIPSNPHYSSLNLAQAVQIIAYELRMKSLEAVPLKPNKSRPSQQLATAEEVEYFYEHLTEVMIAINFWDPENPKRLQQRIRRLFNRVGLENVEVNILRGILSQVQAFLPPTKKIERIE